MEKVILVDEHDNETGSMEKMEAHRSGALHRAFSVLIFNGKGDLLIQKRSKAKYHSAGLWTNTCCSHPRPGEKIEHAAKRRLKEEMGMDVLPVLSHKFIYKVNLGNGLTEHELDYVFFGVTEAAPVVNPTEVEDWKFISMDDLRNEMDKNPETFTHWFKIILKEWEKIIMPTGK